MSSPDPGRTLSSRFEHKHLVCSVPRVCDHMVQVLICIAAVLKALIYIYIYILLICMPCQQGKSYLINYIFLKKKTTALTFTFRHPMSLDCRIQLLLSQGSSFLVVDRNGHAVLLQLQAHPSLGFRLQPGVLENRTKLNREMALEDQERSLL